ncbi:hemerythrin domain-containing protein [Bdellovibrio sp. 22V]|uniref:hemerythrin domain-containing protein n=1 Tax=Bdellovibrio TaxID=958 RepID=UPI002543CAC5|nr:hemerythrin domain-containing protein [Bdellovibrio sp. 22V]WII70734.1 hemerythrin domain-containing protein [Bdellovibrio sp. 22V]
MTIYELLKKDHREVKDLFEEINSSLEDEDFREVENLFNTLKVNLASHAKAEEEVFYRPLRLVSKDFKGEELTWEGEQEHHVVALLLNELSRISFEDEEWKAKIKVLSELVDHHVAEEEGEIFSKAKKVFSSDEAETIAQNMERLKDKYKGMIDNALAGDIEVFNKPITHPAHTGQSMYP